MNDTYQGQCLCGAARYIITAPGPKAMFLCHCSRCRKETGTLHGASVFFSEAGLVWERGQDNLTRFELQGTRKARVFCTTCGSPMPRQEADGQLVLPAGSLDDDSSLQPTAHIYCGSSAAWEPKLAGLARFEALPE